MYVTFLRYTSDLKVFVFIGVHVLSSAHGPDVVGYAVISGPSIACERLGKRYPGFHMYDSFCLYNVHLHSIVNFFQRVEPFAHNGQS